MVAGVEVPIVAGENAANRGKVSSSRTAKLPEPTPMIRRHPQARLPVRPAIRRRLGLRLVLGSE
jgi:hypothetical protein